MTSKFILCFVTVLIFLSSAPAQTTASKAQSAADAKAQQELSRKTQLLLAETVQHARELKSKENQIVTQIEVADMLWKDQEATARRLYQETFETLRQLIDANDQNESESFDDFSDPAEFRVLLLESLSRHDPIMARDLLGKSRPTPSHPSADAENTDASRADSSAPQAEPGEDALLEMTLAIEMVDKDPKEALRIARESLNHGYDSQIGAVIMKLAKKEPKMANEFAVEIANKLRKEGFGSSPEAVSMAVFLIGESISSAKPAREEGQTDKLAPLLDPQSLREFIAFVIDAALKKQPGRANESLLTNLRGLVDVIEEIAPESAARLKQKFLETAKESPEDNPFIRFQEMSQTGNVEEMLSITRTAPREMRDGLYSQAAAAAWRQGDKEKANEIVTKNLSSPSERARLLQGFREETISDLIEDGDFVQARQLIAQTRSIEKRVSQLNDLATALVEKNDQKGALQVLEEALSFVPAKARKQGDLDMQMRIAGALSRVDPARSFAILYSAIDQINELLEATALVVNFTSFVPGAVTLKDNEFAVSSTSRTPFLLNVLSSRDIRGLAQVDFEKTRAVFDRLQRLEMRVAGYLMMSRSILEPEDENCTCQKRPRSLKKDSPGKP